MKRTFLEFAEAENKDLRARLEEAETAVLQAAASQPSPTGVRTFVPCAMTRRDGLRRRARLLWRQILGGGVW